MLKQRLQVCSVVENYVIRFLSDDQLYLMVKLQFPIPFSVENLFIGINPKSTLTWSDSTF